MGGHASEFRSGLSEVREVLPQRTANIVQHERAVQLRRHGPTAARTQTRCQVADAPLTASVSAGKRPNKSDERLSV